MSFIGDIRRRWTISRLLGVLRSQTAIPGSVASQSDLPAYWGSDDWRRCRGRCLEAGKGLAALGGDTVPRLIQEIGTAVDRHMNTPGGEWRLLFGSGSHADALTEALCLAGPAAAEQLVGYVRSQEAMGQYSRQEILATLGRAAPTDPAIVTILLGLWRDGDAEVMRPGAAAGLWSARARVAGLPDALRVIAAEKKMLFTTRTRAVQRLAEIGDEPSWQVVLDAMEDEERFVRKAAATALGGLKDQRAVAGLTKALGDPDGDVAVESALSLGRIGDRLAVPGLEAALGRGEDARDVPVSVALAELGGEKGNPYLERFATRPVFSTFRGYTIPGLAFMVRAAAALEKQTGRKASTVFEQWSHDSDADISTRGRAALALVREKA